MLDVQTLSHYLNELLKVPLFSDYCPNGLQVSGRSSISKMVIGVTACQALIDEAIRLKADAIIVHHGFFWKGENPCIIGMKRNRLKALLSQDLNLFAYHLPLDAHREFGNNAQFAKKFEIQIDPKSWEKPTNLCWFGNFSQEISAEELSKKIAHILSREPLHIAASSKKIKRVAWCTGAAQDAIEQALEFKADAFITGEVSERTVHFARENNLHFYAAGHHATEKFGVEALGIHLEKKFNVPVIFVDIENPV